MGQLLEHEPFRIGVDTIVTDIDNDELRGWLGHHASLEAEIHQNMVTDPEKISIDSRAEMIKTMQQCRVGRRALERVAETRGVLYTSVENEVVDQEGLF